MTFSGKMCFKIILKVRRKQGFTLSLQDRFFEKSQGGWEMLINPSSRFRVKRFNYIKIVAIKWIEVNWLLSGY